MVRSIDKAAREVKIAEIKRQIAAGTYDSPDKMEKAIDAFLSNQPAADSGRPNQPR